MSDVLVRIRVREMHGIRRFLYPLSAVITLPNETDLLALSLATVEGKPVPLQVTRKDGERHRLDFALSLDPLKEKTLTLKASGSRSDVTDRLNVTIDAHGLHNQQEHFSLSLGSDARISNVVYDGIPHLKKPAEVIRLLYQNQESFQSTDLQMDYGSLSAWTTVTGHYHDGTTAQTQTEITACKSWISQRHQLNQPDSAELIHFSLPFATTSSFLTYDFGIGGGIYGKLEQGVAKGLVLTVEAKAEGKVQWKLCRSDADGANYKLDYIGYSESMADLISQLWFHLIDSNKSIAVAITDFPSQCKDITMGFNIEGRVGITFLAEPLADPVTFGVCYHFLNDIPAIAAATNPQSILLPPTVEVLPA